MSIRDQPIQGMLPRRRPLLASASASMSDRAGRSWVVRLAVLAGRVDRGAQASAAAPAHNSPAAARVRAAGAARARSLWVLPAAAALAGQRGQPEAGPVAGEGGPRPIEPRRPTIGGRITALL